MGLAAPDDTSDGKPWFATAPSLGLISSSGSCSGDSASDALLAPTRKDIEEASALSPRV